MNDYINGLPLDIDITVGLVTGQSLCGEKGDSEDNGVLILHTDKGMIMIRVDSVISVKFN